MVILLKKLISILLGCALSLSLFTAGVLGVAEIGSVDNPLPIGTVDELLSFSQRVTAGETSLCAILTADIPASGTIENWMPIGEAAAQVGGESPKPYVGVFNGDGHKLSLSKKTTESPDNACISFFRTIGKDGIVKNLEIEVDFYGRRNLGGVAAYNYGTIEYVTVEGKIESSVMGSSVNPVGGIVARNGSTGKILYCLNRAQIIGGTNIGGIVGDFLGEMRYCVNEGKISGYSAGGLVSVAEGLQTGIP
jgi:hypothetical protein